ncbi:hypothetical protein [Thauera aromatica]|uniref:hypothetical protein n=1 Tax=Thauera aromatica TaxID=59405 RepID=UPI00131C0D4C|nr:hypothetical protein [Thauera aromatica]
MSGLNLLGGIGQGLMAGAQFQQQKNAQDMQLRQNQARLSMLQQDQDWQRQDRDTKQAERKRLSELDQIASTTWSEMGADADPLQVSSEIFKRSVKTGKAKREELEPLLKNVKELRQRGVTAALRMGDAGKLGDALSQSFGRRVTVQPTQGADEFGRPSQLFAVVGEDGTPVRSFTMMQLGSILGADDILADQERQLKMEELRSKAIENEAQAVAARASAGASGAQAGKYAAEAAGQRLENEGLRLLDPKQRPGRKAGSVPAEVQTAEWLIRNGVAKDTASAWDMVRTARGRNAEEAIASIVTKLQGDHLNAGKTVPELVSAAKQIYAEITKPDAPAAPKPSGPISVTSPEEAMRLPPGTEFITPSGARKRVPAR